MVDVVASQKRIVKMKKKKVAFSKAKYVVVHKVESRILFVGLGTKPCPCTCETGVLPCGSIPTWAHNFGA